MNETGLWRMIDERIHLMGFTREEVDIQPLVVDVMYDNITVELQQNTAVLVNKTLDVPITAQLVIDGGNNQLVTSKEDYRHISYANYQFFEDTLNISLNNYGDFFTPFRLEFLQIIPKINKKQ